MGCGSYELTVTRNASRILPEKTQRIWVGRARIVHGKTHESAGVGHPWHINLQSRWSPGAFYMRKHNDFSGVGGPRTYTSRKFTVEMKARRILHWKTQRFLRGWWRVFNLFPHHPYSERQHLGQQMLQGSWRSASPPRKHLASEIRNSDLFWTEMLIMGQHCFCFFRIFVS